MKHNRIFTFFIILFIPWSVYKFFQSPVDIMSILLIIIFVFFYTDLLSGVLHIVLDNERSLKLPIIKSLAEGFQSHHESPKDIYQMSLYNHLYTMHLPLTIMFPAIVLVDSPYSYLVYVATAFTLHLMQMSHRWAHTPRRMLPAGVIFLQKIGLLLSHEIHSKHHNNVYDTNFSIMNGWSNSMLNRLVQIFGRTSHGWLCFFMILFVSLLIFPAFL